MAPWIGRAAGCASAIAGLLCLASPAAAQTMQITSLSDLTFGTVSSVSANQTIARTVCVFSSTGSYTIKASGSGAGEAFTLSNLANATILMPYTVQWAPSGSQTSGTLLTAGQAQRFTPPPLNILCSLGSLLAGTASLIVTLPATSLSAARQGTYAGTLTLLVSPN